MQAKTHNTRVRKLQYKQLNFYPLKKRLKHIFEHKALVIEKTDMAQLLQLFFYITNKTKSH